MTVGNSSFRFFSLCLGNPLSLLEVVREDCPKKRVDTVEKILDNVGVLWYYLVSNEVIAFVVMVVVTGPFYGASPSLGERLLLLV